MFSIVIPLYNEAENIQCLLEEIFTNDFYKGYFNNLLKLNPTIIHNEQGGIC